MAGQWDPAYLAFVKGKVLLVGDTKLQIAIRVKLMEKTEDQVRFLLDGLDDEGIKATLLQLVQSPGGGGGLTLEQLVQGLQTALQPLRVTVEQLTETMRNEHKGAKQHRVLAEEEHAAARMERERAVVEFTASEASSTRMGKVLASISLEHCFKRIPCCAEHGELPELSQELEPYVWAPNSNEANAVNVSSGRKWLQDVVCPKDVVVVAVQSQGWLEAYFPGAKIRIKGSKTDFMFLTMEALSLLDAQLKLAHPLDALKYVLAFYETKIIKVDGEGRPRGLLSTVWPQAVAECLALNAMADSLQKKGYFIPVFGGDLNRSIVVHAAEHGAVKLHIAEQDGNDTRTAARYMRYWLEKTQRVVRHALGVAAEDLEVTNGNGTRKRRRYAIDPNERLDENDAPDGGAADQDDGGADDRDDGERMQDAENAFHLALIDFMKSPETYKALGQSGPPTRIEHSSLEDWFGSMKFCPPTEI